MNRTIIGSLRAILSCDFTTLDEAIFRHRLMTFKWTEHLSLSTLPFKACLKRRENLTQCLPVLVRSCRRSRVVAVKVIRLHMSLVEELLSADPGLRVIHLVRDPRGMMESWRKVSVPKQTAEQMRIGADIACKRMLKDCDTRRRLEETFPGRIRIVRYEDLVTNTEHVVRNIYNSLLQLEVPDSVTKELSRQLNADSQDGVTGTKRKNGTKTAYRWKQEIDRGYLDYVNKTCRPILSLLKYDST